MIYFEISDNSKYKNFSRQAYGVSKEKCTKANMIPVIRIYLLYLQTVLITAGTGVTI